MLASSVLVSSAITGSAPKAMIPAREIAANFLIIELLLSLKMAYFIFQPSFSHVYIVDRL